MGAVVLASTLGGTALTIGLAQRPSTASAGESVQAVMAPRSSATQSSTAAAPDAGEIAAAIEARERTLVSRGTARSSAPTVEPVAPTVEPAPAAPAAPVEPAPAAPVIAPVPPVVGQLWVTTDVNVRSGPSAGDERIGNLAALSQVDVTGATESGWTQVVVDGRAGWVNASYLAEWKPEPQAAPAPAGVSSAACSISSSIESSLTSNARAVYRAVCAAFGNSVSSFGGYRAGDGGDHGSGRAVDIMVTGEPGWQIARYVQANAAEFGVSYVIYQQKIWQAGNSASAWEYMSDRGSSTANHYDHVHVSVS